MSWTPVPHSTTRRATSGWSRPKRTTTIGTPAHADVVTIPMPPWQTTADAMESTLLAILLDVTTWWQLRRAEGLTQADTARHVRGLVDALLA